MSDITIPIGEATLAEAERMVIEATLAFTGGNVFRASVILDISYAGLRLKLKRWQREDREKVA